MAGAVNLPPGFELDSNLPPGFQLDGVKSYPGASGFTGPAPKQPVSPSDDPSVVGPMALPHALGGAFNAIDKAAYGAGDWTSEKAHNMGASPEVSGGIGAAVNAGIQSVPTMALGGPLGEAVGAVTKPVGRWLMGTSIKPIWKAWDTGKADRAINTMLTEPNWTLPGVNASEGGMNYLRSRSKESQALVDQLIKGSSETINPRAAANYGQDAIKQFANQPNALRAQDDIASVMDTFMHHPKVAGNSDISVQVAQDLKKGYYKALGDKNYDELKTAGTEGEKAIARGLKEQIEAKVPEVIAPNAQTRELINAIKIGDRRVQMSNNNNPLGLASIAESPVGVAAFLADKWGLGKSALARILYSAIPDASKASIPAAQLAESLRQRGN